MRPNADILRTRVSDKHADSATKNEIEHNPLKPDVDRAQIRGTDRRDDRVSTTESYDSVDPTTIWGELQDSSNELSSQLLPVVSTSILKEAALCQVADVGSNDSAGGFEEKEKQGEEVPSLIPSLPMDIAESCLEKEEQGGKVPSLIPGLPMDIGESCLARIPWSCQPKLMSVCKTWSAYFRSGNVFSLRSRQHLSESLLVVLSVPVRLGPLRLTVFDAKAATTLDWHKPVAVFDYLQRWSGFLRGFRCAVVGPDLFIIGGRHDGLRYATGKNVWRFNFVTRKWTEAARMHVARRDFACAVIDRKIYVAGGTDSNRVLPQGHGDRSVLKSAEMYDYDTDRWVDLPELAIERVGCLGVGLEGRFYVIGGGSDYGTVEFELTRSAEVFDTAEQQWNTIDEMWQSHVKLPRAAAGFDHSLFAVDSNDQTLKCYDETSNAWNNVMPMPSSSTILPSRNGMAEQQQAMGGLPGDQLVDYPREGLFWMQPCSRLSNPHEYHLLQLRESESSRSWDGNVAHTVGHQSSSSARTQRSLNRDFKSLGRNSYLIIGSGIAYI